MSPVLTSMSAELERSQCILPPTADRTAVTPTFSTDEPPIPSDSDQDRDDVACAAWTLTLQCFIVADAFTFAVSGCSDATNAPDQLCVVHVDQDEPVPDLIRAFSTQGCGTKSQVSRVSASSNRHHCNTAITLQSESTQAVSFELPHETDVHLVLSRSTCKLICRASHTRSTTAQAMLDIFVHIYHQLLSNNAILLVSQIDKCPPDHLAQLQAHTRHGPQHIRRSIHDLILEQCRQRPNEPAIVCTRQSITYRQLDDASARLARHLITLGVRPETFVLSCFNKSAAAIIARLAILRAGGAYISIHANNPPSYLGAVLDQTQAQILLTDAPSAVRFKGILPTMVVLSDAFWQSLPVPDAHYAWPSVSSDNACLVLFTSGSTGTPKGIVQTHLSYATGIVRYANRLGLDHTTRYLQFDDYAFDISNIEFFTPLIMGGACIVPDYMETIHDLAWEITSKQANCVFLTPTIAIKLDPSQVDCLVNLCVGGEPLSRELIAKWQASPTRLLCQYGMGEAAVCCALNTELSPAAGHVVGRPATGALWVVDPLSIDKLMPIGACGEILVEGPHLARGYLDPATANRSSAGFVTATPSWLHQLHPERASSTRLYRSGDLGRVNPDGSVSYLGRKDTILKLDGCRIDALEIEHLARTCLRPADVIIVDLLGVPGSRRDPVLTALVHIQTPASPSSASTPPSFTDATTDARTAAHVDQIRRAVAQLLPPYMVPTLFLAMSHVPYTASKKINRKAIREAAQAWYARLMDRVYASAEPDMGLQVEHVDAGSACVVGRVAQVVS